MCFLFCVVVFIVKCILLLLLIVRILNGQFQAINCSYFAGICEVCDGVKGGCEKILDKTYARNKSNFSTKSEHERMNGIYRKLTPFIYQSQSWAFSLLFHRSKPKPVHGKKQQFISLIYFHFLFFSPILLVLRCHFFLSFTYFSNY